MTEHYYTKTPASAHDRKMLETELRGLRLRFATDAGVFSKGAIDYGSRLLIESLKLPQDARVLDIGCGYGPIGISAALLARQGAVVMADINERALQLAASNAALNRADNVRVICSNLLDQVQDREYTHILSNPPIRAGKQVVHRLFEQARDHLADGGELWIVIQKKQGAPSALARLNELYDEVVIEGKDRGYFVYRAIKARP